MGEHVVNCEATVSNAEFGFYEAYERFSFPDENMEEVKSANCLIVPQDYCGDGTFLFPEVTLDLYHYLLKEQSDNGLIVEIAASDDDFQRLQQHSALIDIGVFIVRDCALPVLLGVISNFIYDLVTRRRRKPGEMRAKAKIIVEDEQRGQRRSIEYEGPVEGIKESLDVAASRIFDDGE